MTDFKEYTAAEKQAVSDINKCSSADELENIRVKYIGRQGLLKDLFSQMGKSPEKERPARGRELNRIKKKLTDLMEKRKSEFVSSCKKEDIFDPTLPPPLIERGKIHPVRKVLNEVENIFRSMGFGVAYGPDVETEYYNFTALNIPENHPARAMHDTFYVKGYKNTLLRTHTSPVQVRVMEKKKPPYKFIAPGRCYRRDTVDASHLPVFHQVEGLMVDCNVTFADLKGVLHLFAKRMFGSKVKTRFRPSFFPFTEPSAEMDISCGICKGKGCPSCSYKGWLEILGAGMVDPEVFSHCGVDSDKWQGFAFGMGIERIAMLKYDIHDLRLFIQNDLRFLKQF